MGNAITHLKFRISSIPPELPESEVLNIILGHLLNDSRVISFFAGQGITSACDQWLHSREDPFSWWGNLSVLHEGYQWWWCHSSSRTVRLLSILTCLQYNYLTIHYSSSIVQKCLMDAHEAGKDFRVIVVDSRPKMEGLLISNTYLSLRARVCCHLFHWQAGSVWES